MSVNWYFHDVIMCVDSVDLTKPKSHWLDVDLHQFIVVEETRGVPPTS